MMGGLRKTWSSSWTCKISHALETLGAATALWQCIPFCYLNTNALPLCLAPVCMSTLC